MRSAVCSRRSAWPDAGHARPPARAAPRLAVRSAAGRGREDEGQNGLDNPLRDLTALTVVEIDPTGGGGGFGAYTYRVADRKQWIGVKHTALYAELLALARHWRAVQVVVDATGVGAGLASFLERALPGRVTRFVFSAASKSRLGWDFLSVVETGRWQEYAPQGADAEQEAFFRQLAHCKMDVQPGAERRMQWACQTARAIRRPASFCMTTW